MGSFTRLGAPATLHAATPRATQAQRRARGAPLRAELGASVASIGDADMDAALQATSLAPSLASGAIYYSLWTGSMLLSGAPRLSACLLAHGDSRPIVSLSPAQRCYLCATS